MFGFYFRPYMPGFRVRPQDDTPGFNVNEDGLSPYSIAQADTPHASDVPTPEREFVIQAAPLTDLPGFRLYPQYDVPGFNVNKDGLLPYSIARGHSARQRCSDAGTRVPDPSGSALWRAWVSRLCAARCPWLQR